MEQALITTTGVQRAIDRIVLIFAGLAVAFVLAVLFYRIGSVART